MRKMKIIITALSILTLVGSMSIGVLLGQRSDSDIRAALDSCLLDVETNCKGIFEYAVMLENENSRLNASLKECQQQN